MASAKDILIQNGITDDSTSLAHYGVKGMRWGVRKDRRQRNDGDSSPKKTSSRANRVKKAPKKKKAATRPNLSSLSNEQLAASIRRLELEQQFARLTAPKKSATRQFVADVLKNSGKQTATQFSKNAMGATLTLGLNKLASQSKNEAATTLLNNLTKGLAGPEKKKKSDD